MIPFFRKIRYDLMEKNKTGKYLKYAIGEIMLVVIGILIALQINNWNEKKAELKVELVYMQNILEDLKADTIIYSDYLENNYMIYTLIDSITLHLKSPERKNHIDKLTFWTRMLTTQWTPIHPVKRTYEQMKSSGQLRLIKNQKVAYDISFYYNSLFLLDTYNEAGLIWISDYAKSMGRIFDGEVLLNILKERKEQNTGADALLTEDKVILNELITSAQYFYGSLKLSEDIGKEKSAIAKNLIELIQKEYQLE